MSFNNSHFMMIFYNGINVENTNTYLSETILKYLNNFLYFMMINQDTKLGLACSLHIPIYSINLFNFDRRATLTSHSLH